jgi:ABC-type sugar transport system ATPase subunit
MPESISKTKCEVLLELNNVSSEYINKKIHSIALRHVTFSLPESSFYVIVGPSGCGKSTLLRTILGFQDYGGDILLEGQDIESIPIKERGIAYIPQSRVLYPNLNVFDNIAFPLRNAHLQYEEVNQRVNAVAEKLGISFLLTRKPRQISGGQAQKVALARAVANYSRLFLFDEPFSDLDEKAKRELWVFLKKSSNEIDGSFLFVTHDLQEAFALADTLIVMDKGTVQQIGTPHECLAHPATQFVKDFFSSSGECV